MANYMLNNSINVLQGEVDKTEVVCECECVYVYVQWRALIIQRCHV